MSEAEADSEPDLPAQETLTTPTSPARWLRLRAVVLWSVVGVCALGIPIAVRVVVDGRAALEQAQHAEDIDLRIEWLGRAARWRMPGFTHDDEALAQLMRVGEAAQTRGDWTEALAAFREVRRAILGTRAWGVPHRETFDLANERIATLMAEREAADHTDAGGQGDPYAYHLQLLQAQPGPDPVRGNLAALAFLTWLLSSAAFVARGIDAKGRLVPRRATRWGAAVLVSLVAWCVLLATAG